MDAITSLLTRNSCALLGEPAPSGEDREYIFKAALRAPDHANLKPWRFLCVEGNARQKLGDLMCDAALKNNPQLEEGKQKKLRNAPARAPLVVVVAAKISEHPKVPEVEQLLSAGSALTNMLNAAHALGFAGIWRTGDISFNRTFMDSMGLAHNEKIVGFLYLGTATSTSKKLAELPVDQYFEDWNP